jgi:hypothetical protein
MVNADQYRAMALQHHRWAGMCRSPESREEHFRLEKELRVLADNEERLHGLLAPAQVSNSQKRPLSPSGGRNAASNCVPAPGEG